MIRHLSLISLSALAAVAVVLPLAAAPLDIKEGPLLVNPTETSVSVALLFDKEYVAGVEIRKAGTLKFSRVWARKGGPVHTGGFHRLVHLEQLSPGTAYEYRVIARDADYMHYPDGAKNEQARELLVNETIHKFTTLSAKSPGCRALFTSDIHGRREPLAKLLDYGRFRQSDFLIVGGDSLGNLNTPDHIYTRTDSSNGFFGTLVDSGGTDVPVVILRGNHEWDGKYADCWVERFGTPAGVTWSAFRCGPVLFINLEKPDTDWNLNYVERELEFIEDVLASEMSRTAKFRVVALHIAPTGTAMAVGPGPTSRQLTRCLSQTGDRRIHLVLAGHQHVYTRIDGGSSKVKVNSANPDGRYSKTVYGDNLPYTVVCNDGVDKEGVDDSIIAVECDGGILEISALDAAGHVFDRFSVDSEGNVSDLMPVKVFDR